MPLVEDTIRLKAKFYDFSGNPLNLNNILITIYDKDKEILDEIEENDIENPDSGEYEYDYTIPKEERGYITVEFKGEFGDNKTTSIRRRVNVEWEEVGEC